MWLLAVCLDLFLQYGLRLHRRLRPSILIVGFSYFSVPTPKNPQLLYCCCALEGWTSQTQKMDVTSLECNLGIHLGQQIQFSSLPSLLSSLPLSTSIQFILPFVPLRLRPANHTEKRRKTPRDKHCRRHCRTVSGKRCRARKL